MFSGTSAAGYDPPAVVGSNAPKGEFWLNPLAQVGFNPLAGLESEPPTWAGFNLPFGLGSDPSEWAGLDPIAEAVINSLMGGI